MNAPVLLFGAFGILLIMGAPITLALALSATVTYLYVGQELTTLVQIAFSSVNSFPIMALPAFVLAGALMECAGISRRIVTVAEHMVGQMSGGWPSPRFSPASFSAPFRVRVRPLRRPWACS